MEEQVKNSTPMDQTNNRITQLFNNQEIIVNKINEHNKALNHLQAELKELQDYLAALVESYKTVVESQSKMGETVLNYEEIHKASQTELEDLKQQLEKVVSNAVANSVPNSAQKIIEEQASVIEQFHKTHSKLVMQITEKQKELELHAAENRNLMEQINTRRWEMLDLTAKYNIEHMALNKKLNNINVALGILSLVVVVLAIKLFI